MTMKLYALLPMLGPDFGAVGGSSQLRAIVGFASDLRPHRVGVDGHHLRSNLVHRVAQGSWQTASKAKTGLFVALGGAVLAGSALAWTNWLLDVSATM